MCRSLFLLTESAILLHLSNLPEKRVHGNFWASFSPLLSDACVFLTLGGRAVWHPELIWSLMVQKSRERDQQGHSQGTGAGSLSKYQSSSPSQSQVSCKTFSRSPILTFTHISSSPLTPSLPCTHKALLVFKPQLMVATRSSHQKNSVSYHILTYPNLLNFL